MAQFTPGKHCVPKQQPLAQEFALHSQLPPMHCDPVGQGGPPPQLQVPFVHPSAKVALHVVHALPFEPQKAADVGVSQVAPLQHPLAQFCEQPVHALLTHGKLPQLAQDPPKAPHAVELVPSWHTPFWSQHPAQFVPLHTHWPLTHERPFEQAGPPPHVHAPPVHASEVVGSQTVHAPASPPQVASEDVSQLLP